MGYFFGVLVAFGVVVFTAWVQHCYWVVRDKVRYYEKEEGVALSLIDDFSLLSYKRLHRQRRKLWSVKSNKNDPVVEKEYTDVVNEWNERLGVLLARIKYSFGREAAWEVEYVIQRDFYILHGNIMELEKGVVEKGKSSEIEEGLNALGSKIVSVVETFMHRVREGRFSTFPIEKQVSFSNRKRLSCSYLVARLFGLS